MIPRRVLGACVCLAGACASVSCRSAGSGAPQAHAPAPEYAEVVERYNERAAMLSRVWARCSVAFRYTDEQGERHAEQGEGHLQIMQPDRLALSVGKLGETLLWIGGDAERYWAFDLTDNKRAYVGRYKQLTAQKAARIGIPVVPTEIAALLGVVPFSPRAAASVERAPDGQLRIRLPIGTRAAWVYKVDEPTMEPSEVRLEVMDEVVLRGVLSNYTRVAVKGVALGPRIAGRIFITHEPSGSTVNLQLDESVNDGTGGAGRLRSGAFDFDALVDALGPVQVIDVDEPPTSAPRSDE